MMDILAQRLAAVKEQQLYRTRETYEPLDATHVLAGQEHLLVLASNNYLGLTHHPAVCRAAALACSYGTGSGGSRLTTGSHPLFRLLEAELAVFKGAQAGLVFNCGYMANVGVISALAGSGDVIFSDELNHASIIDGCRLSAAKTVVYRHRDSCHLAEKMKETPCQGLRLVVTDGVFSMDGDIAPLDEIVQVAEGANALVMVDDAHATGVIGPGGRGTTAHFGLEGRVAVQMGTLSKSLAAEGGYIVGSKLLVDYVVNKARSFIFSTAMSPMAAAAGLAALQQLAAEPELVERLAANGHFLRNRLSHAGLAVVAGQTPIIPVMVGDAAKAVRLATDLRQAGILVSAIRPPTVPPGTSRLRITVSAAHTTAELADAADEIIAAVGRI
jgi:8-amino-7-oxononanoate synthase